MSPRDAIDVAVVGAGPAGIAAAIAAARAGARVVVVDRARFPRPKVCGGCLSPLGVSVVESLGAGRVLRDAAPLDAVRISCRGRTLRLRRAAGVAISRAEFDHALVGEARALGVEVREGSIARVTADERLELRQSGGEATESLAARVIVVADGLSGGALDLHPTLASREDPASRIGFGAILPPGAAEVAPGEIHLVVHDGGYIGLVRLCDGSIDIAAAVDPSTMRRLGGPAACAARWLEACRVDPAALASARWLGTPRLTRRRVQTGLSRVLVAGDAAGYVEPFTGEGMGWAIAGGAAAGIRAARAARAEMQAEQNEHRAVPDDSIAARGEALAARGEVLAAHGGALQRDRVDAGWDRELAQLTRVAKFRCAAVSRLMRRPTLVSALLAVGHTAPWPLEVLAGSIGRARAVLALPRGEVRA